MSIQPDIAELIRMAQRGRVRPTLKPMRSHTGFIFVPIEHTKPVCVVCGGRVGKGRHFTCSLKCQKKETLRVKLQKKRNREAKRPSWIMRPFPKRMIDALGGLFG